jgi:hypothetical protein
MASIINATTTNGLSTSADNSGSLQLATNNGTTAVTIDTSQNVGIGTTSPATKFHVSGQTRIADSSDSANRITIGVGANAPYGNASISTTTAGLAIVAEGAGNMTFSNNGSERMRINSAGNVIIATGTLEFTNPNGVTTPTANGQGSIGTYNIYGTTLTGQGSSYDISFFNKNQAVAGYVATGATTITTSSDERLKENLVPITNALATVNNLRTVTGNYKADPSRNVAFFIAQDMKEHFPQAFEDANPDAFGVNYNWTIPLLAAAIKELKAELDATKAEVQALKGVA